jgi:hypothetical protein
MVNFFYKQTTNQKNMKVQILNKIQARLEVISVTTKSLSLDIAKLRDLEYSIKNQSTMYAEIINQTKTHLKTNLDTIIVELHDIKQQVE